MNEYELIKKYFQKLSNNNPSSFKLNDDVFFYKKNKLVVSVDTYNEGVHFPNFKSPNLVIKKVLRSSISDLICKGVKPDFYFISVSGNKKNFTKKNLHLISKSLKQEQKKFNIKLSGGDTTNSSKVSFSITTIGFSNKIIPRNNAKINDDIYVTGNIGDSFIGLKIIKNKIHINKKLQKYFIKKYYCPDIPYKITNHLNTFANTSMDISDGLIGDIKKLINNLNLSFEIYLDQIPISVPLKTYLRNSNKKKEKYLFNGDDYQTLFTAHIKFRKFIKNLSIRKNQKITIIGKINSNSKNNVLLSSNHRNILTDYQGYFHKF
ncbi:MAG: thiamine-phosphate kinase [Candidatus Pelagibacter sp.]|nr:thiamine-phosphate kinase [Candidatus Pelagibacter sp.]